MNTTELKTVLTIIIIGTISIFVGSFMLGGWGGLLLAFGLWAVLGSLYNIEVKADASP